MSHIQQSTVAVSVTSAPLEGYPGPAGHTADPDTDCDQTRGSSLLPVLQMVFSNGGRAGGGHDGKMEGGGGGGGGAFWLEA